MTEENTKFKQELKKAGFTHVDISEEIMNIDFSAPLKSPNGTEVFPGTQQKISAIVSINEGEVFITMKAQDWLSIIKETDRVKSVFCPICKSSNIAKNGTHYKFKKKYICLNPECSRTSFNV